MARVVVAGVGKVGLPLACHFRDLGHVVIGVDTNTELVRMLRDVQHPLRWEPGIYLAGLEATTSLREALENAEALVIAVPTPLEGSRLSPRFVLDTIRAARDASYTGLILIASTLDARDASRVCEDEQILYTPVLIRLGHVMEDLRSARLFLIGAPGPVPADAERFWPAWAIWYPQGAPSFLRAFESDPTTIAVAKLAINATLSSRVAWANDVAERAENFGANPDTVLQVLGADPRIGSSFLRDGWPPAGPCLPRDMDVWCSEKGLGLAEVILGAHTAKRQQILERVARFVSEKTKAVEAAKIVILGVTYNVGALDITDSLGLAIFRMARTKGWIPLLMDPAIGSFGREFAREIGPRGSEGRDAQDYVKSWADVVIVATAWPQFRALDFGDTPVLDLTWEGAR